MKPIKEWDTARRGYKFGVKTSYSNFHLGVDHIAACGVPILMPFTGRIVKTSGKQGGNTIHIYPEVKKEFIRILHCSWVASSGNYKEGDIIGKVGTTGLSTGCHTHTDISKNGKLELTNLSNFTDPEKYNWKGENVSDQEFREAAWNVVNGFYQNYYGGTAGREKDINDHTEAIAKYQPRKYAISNWVNRQKDEVEFKSKMVRIEHEIVEKRVEVPVEVVKEKIVEVIKEVPVIKETTVEKVVSDTDKLSFWELIAVALRKLGRKE